jgi:hypothetical protein
MRLSDRNYCGDIRRVRRDIERRAVRILIEAEVPRDSNSSIAARHFSGSVTKLVLHVTLVDVGR